MKDSADRIQFITDYMFSYQSKIRALNKAGLFDNATLFELFAQRVCELLFDQKFMNLNECKANYPCVDLISEDKNIYIQVSTTQNIQNKIKNTLEKLQDSKIDLFQNIKKLYFFVLSNESEIKLKDYTGDSKIGNIDFTVKENIISSNSIINKAKMDLNFQIKLYDLLCSEDDSLNQISERLHEAITLSKSLINNNIDHLINNEYSIDVTIHR